MRQTTVDLTNSGERPKPSLRALRDLADGGRVAFLPVTLLEPGQALLLPFAQITGVQSPPHAHGDIQVQLANSVCWSHFTPESWSLVFIPDDPWEPCTTCARTWADGCEPDCGARRISDERTAAALAAAGLTGPWPPAQILGTRP